MFLTWARRQHLSVSTAASLGDSLLKWGEHLFRRGDKADTFNQTVAALNFFRPDLQESLPMQRKLKNAKKGFRKLSPSMARLPMPWPVVAGAINSMVALFSQRGRPAYCSDLCTVPETLRAAAFDMSQCDSTGSLAQHCMESSVTPSRAWPPQQSGGLL
eukprot:4552922-Amphidinium_carterae.1